MRDGHHNGRNGDATISCRSRLWMRPVPTPGDAGPRGGVVRAGKFPFASVSRG